MKFKIQKSSPIQTVGRVNLKEPVKQQQDQDFVPSTGGPTPLPYDYFLDEDPMLNGGSTYSMTGGLLSLLEESEEEEKVMAARQPQMIQTQQQVQQQVQQQAMTASQQASMEDALEKLLILAFGAFIGYLVSKSL